ncbi:hypothetical protein [Rouxiella badensis]|uniref:hypothetical protein n=1 Tax=Rouxiella badensis TaxID=1646377 RepID=UPI0022AB0E2B|nr:hypothetical protein [Rouxiella badensis]WAT10107.1 hypothetical protein O1V65_05970 [Rouxiella badensis]
MPIDHGVLNLPLAKRGNFHKELDDHLEAESRRKEDALYLRKAEFNKAKEEAKRLYALMDDSLIKAEAKKRGMKVGEFREVLMSIRDSRPKLAPVAFSALTVTAR